MTTTAKRMMMKLLPISAVMARAGAASTPASPASAMPKPNTGVTQRPTLIPRARVRSGASVAARTIMPMRVCVSSRPTATHTTTEKRQANTEYVERVRLPQLELAVEAGRHRVGQARRRRTSLDRLDEHERQPEGEQEVVERVERQQPAHEQPLHEHPEAEHEDRHDDERDPEADVQLPSSTAEMTAPSM